MEGDASLVEINPLILTPDGRVHALDAKVSLDDNAAFRHPEWEAFREVQVLDPREELAQEKGLQYVGLQGNVGIVANGAGLAMSTLDVVNQVGGQPANFLDVGGGASAEVMANALEVVNSDPNVRSIFINIFGGITRGEEVANGVVEAMRRVTLRSPIVIRLDGTNAEQGRAILKEHESERLISRPTMVERRPHGGAARGAGGAPAPGAPAPDRLLQGGRRPVSILVDETTKVVYQGLSPRPGNPGVFYALRNREYGTQVVAGTNPGRGGTEIEGIPIYATVGEAKAATGATASCIFVPAPNVASAVLEAAEAGMELVVVISEGVPAHDEARFYNQLRQRVPRDAPPGPQLPRADQPREVQHRDHRRGDRPGGRAGGDRLPLRHPHLPGPLRADPEGDRADDVRGDRGRPGAGDDLHRLPAGVPGRPADEGGDPDRGDRRGRRKRRRRSTSGRR